MTDEFGNVDDIHDAASAPAAGASAPAADAFELESSDTLAPEEWSDSETAFLSHFPNRNSERTLAVALVRLSRKV